MTKPRSNPARWWINNAVEPHIVNDYNEMVASELYNDDAKFILDVIQQYIKDYGNPWHDNNNTDTNLDDTVSMENTSEIE